MSGNIDLVQTFHPKVFFFVIYPIVHVVRLSVCGYLLLGSYTHIFGQEINFKRRKKYLLQLLHNGKMNVEDLELVLFKLLRIQKKYIVLAIFFVVYWFSCYTLLLKIYHTYNSFLQREYENKSNYDDVKPSTFLQKWSSLSAILVETGSYLDSLFHFCV